MVVGLEDINWRKSSPRSTDDLGRHTSPRPLEPLSSGVFATCAVLPRDGPGGYRWAGALSPQLPAQQTSQKARPLDCWGRAFCLVYKLPGDTFNARDATKVSRPLRGQSVGR
jgi:hypothetical protein